jgi:hypothetical protein
MADVKPIANIASLLRNMTLRFKHRVLPRQITQAAEPLGLLLIDAAPHQHFADVRLARMIAPKKAVPP